MSKLLLPLLPLLPLSCCCAPFFRSLWLGRKAPEGGLLTRRWQRCALHPAASRPRPRWLLAAARCARRLGVAYPALSRGPARQAQQAAQDVDDVRDLPRY